MDWILCLEGFVIICDILENISYIKKYLILLKWDKWMIEIILNGDFLLVVKDERVLIVRKKFWSVVVILEL